MNVANLPTKNVGSDDYKPRSKLTLIELSDGFDVGAFIQNLNPKKCLLYSNSYIPLKGIEAVGLNINSTKHALKAAKIFRSSIHIISLIDEFDLDLGKRKRMNVQIKNLHRILKALDGESLIVISGRPEYRIREMADSILNKQKI